MKKVLISTILILGTALCLYYFASGDAPMQSATASEKKAASVGYYDGVTGIKKAGMYLNRIRTNQVTGEIDAKEVHRARAKTKELQAAKGANEMEWEFMGPNNVGGRTRALIIDKDNSNKLYTGGVAGGIWKSNDGGNNWTEYSGNTALECLAIVSGCQGQDGDLYFGTGEGFYYFGGQGSAGILGEGIYKSSDDGNTFELLEATRPADTNNAQDGWGQVNVMAAHPTKDIIYAGIGNGIRLSEDGGATWTNPLTLGSTCWDISIGSDDVVHVVIGSKYFRSNDGLVFEEKSGTSLELFPQVSGRKRIKVAPSNPEYVYAVAVGSNSCLRWVRQSTDGGDTWVEIGTGGSDYFSPLSNSVQCQGDYDLALGVDGADEGRIYVAGITMWSWEEDGGWQEADNLFEDPSNLYYIHADKHDIQFDPQNANKMYIVCDGGVFKSDNAQSENPTFRPVNKNYNVTQFYSVAAGLDGEVIGGTQDNGTQLVDFASNAVFTSTEVSGGDGGYTEISDINPQGIFAATPNGNLFRSGNGGLSFTGYLDENIDCVPRTQQGACTPNGSIDGGAEFVTPFVLWEDLKLFIDSNKVNARLITGSGNEDGLTANLWVTDEPLDFATIPQWYNIASFQSGASAVVSCVAASKDGKTIFAGTNNGRIIRVTGMNTTADLLENHNLLNPDGGAPGSGSNNPANVTEIAVPNEFGGGRYITSMYVSNFSNTLYVTLGNYGNDENIIVTNNALADADVVSFASAQYNLPPMPVFDLVVDKGNPNLVIAGTELGVWCGERVQVGIDAYEYEWSPQNVGIGNVPVFRLRQENIRQVPLSEFVDLTPDCYVTYIGTHGRGLYRSSTLAQPICEIPSPQALWLANNNIATPTMEVKLYPNPTRNNVNLAIDLPKTANVTVQIFDLQARLVQEKDLGTQTEGSQTVNLSLNNLTAGTYMVVLTAEKQRITKKLMVQ